MNSAIELFLLVPTDLAIEVFDKCRRIKPVLPLTSLRNFVPLKVAAS